ncbi:MAG TPA: CaiB/BaiF CoA-transferase family protein [Acidimicrobiales bacterium]|nr:CaiB/BaiF CoA-transferase family protein [Acidimicrobiales bacterium]
MTTTASVEKDGGPLRGVRVLEVASLAPGPFAGVMLADMGADIVRIDRLESVGAQSGASLLGRGRRSIAADLKHPDAAEVMLRLVERADILIEGFRPGVMERLGLSPDVCLARNPALVYGRMTGFGQEGPWAHAAGHDINYIAIAGALGMIGRRDQPPTPPLNLVGDFGGGGMLLAFGLLCGLLEARASGRGQVVDAAMVDGSALLMLPFFGTRPRDAGGLERSERGTNMLDSGAPFYDAYETADGKWVSVGAIEPQFYAELLRGLELDPASLPPQMDADRWPQTKARFASIFRTRTRDQWCAVFEATDACFAPVLELDEVARHPHNAARSLLVEVAGVPQPAPAPRLSVSPGSIRRPPPSAGEHTDEVLVEWGGLEPFEIQALRAAGAIG